MGTVSRRKAENCENWLSQQLEEAWSLEDPEVKAVPPPIFSPLPHFLGEYIPSGVSWTHGVKVMKARHLARRNKGRVLVCKASDDPRLEVRAFDSCPSTATCSVD